MDWRTQLNKMRGNRFNTPSAKIAKAIGLEYEDEDIFIGTCPFCNLQDVFGISAIDEFAYCSHCGYLEYDMRKFLACLCNISKFKTLSFNN